MTSHRKPPPGQHTKPLPLMPTAWCRNGDALATYPGTVKAGRFGVRVDPEYPGYAVVFCMDIAIPGLWLPTWVRVAEAVPAPELEGMLFMSVVYRCVCGDKMCARPVVSGFMVSCTEAPGAGTRATILEVDPSHPVSVSRTIPFAEVRPLVWPDGPN